MQHILTTPLTQEKLQPLQAGDTVLLSGTIYTARDAAHKRLCELLAQNKPLPIAVQDSIIYYVGPCPAQDGQVIGSAGPTTSYRMDAYAPALIEQGLTGMIGKGKRNDTVIQAIQQHGAVYFGAIGGAGALLASCITQSELICYEDLGSEAIRKLTVNNMPLTVVIDAKGNNLYQTGPQAYLNYQEK